MPAFFEPVRFFFFLVLGFLVFCRKSRLGLLAIELRGDAGA